MSMSTGARAARRAVCEPLEVRRLLATIFVNSLGDNLFVDGQVTLREAIQAANTDTSVDGSAAGSGADVIQFEPALFFGPRTIILNPVTGSLRPTTDITVTGPGANLLTVRNNDNGRVFSVVRGSPAPLNVTLRNLTISGDGVRDGGIEMNNASLTIANSVLTNNGVDQGSGGAVSSIGGNLTIIDSAITNNAANQGGGIYTEDGNLTITRTTITGNSAQLVGGGIYVFLGDASIDRTLIADNSSALSGGGIGFFEAGTHTLTNVTLSNNSAADQGGGIGNFINSHVDLVNCTLTLNRADGQGGGDQGGGIATAPNSLRMINTIVAGNVHTTSPDVAGAVVSFGTNLIGNTAGSTGFGGSDLIGVDPLLSPLGDHGGATKTHALLPGSPAIDGGQGGLLIPLIDQREVVRAGGIVDIGAFESRGFSILAERGPAGSDRRTLVNTPFDDRLAAVVSSAFGEPVAEGRVTFSAIPAANGASAFIGAPNPATTLPNGSVAVTATANGIGSAPGTPYFVEASARGASSARFDLTNQVVGSLAFRRQPTDTGSGNIINQLVGGVTVALLDQDGFEVPKATDAVAITAGPAPLASGTTPRSAVAGVATFNDLVIRQASDDNRLTASLPANPSVQPVVSASFRVLNQRPTTVGIPNVNVEEDAPDTLISLWDAFDDAEDGGIGLSYAVLEPTNPSLFGPGFGFNRKTGVLTLNYAPDANGIASLTVRAMDSAGSTVAASFTVTVNPVNDAPTGNAPGPQTTPANVPLLFSSAGGNKISISDIDAGSNPVLVTLEVDRDGTLTLSRTTGLAFQRGDGTADDRLAFTGSIADINAALEGMRFNPDTGEREGRATVTMTIDDLGHSGAGGALKATDGVAITMTPAVSALSVEDVSANESKGEVVFAVRLAPLGSGEFRVSYSTADGTAIQGQDYERTEGELIFAAGEREKTVRVKVTQDRLDEADETFFLNITSQDVAVADGQAVGTIIDQTPPRVTDAAFVYQTAPHRVRFTFSQNVQASLAAADLLVEKLGAGGGIAIMSEPVYDLATNTATFDFVGGVLGDGNYKATLRGAGVSRANGTPMDGDYVLNFHVLAGDIDRDRDVDFDDLAVMAQNYNKTGRTFVQGNFDYDAAGNVDFNDLAMLAQRYNRSLPPPAPVPAPAPAGVVAATANQSEILAGLRRSSDDRVFNADVPIRKPKAAGLKRPAPPARVRP